MSLFPAYKSLSDNSSKDENNQQSCSSGYSWLNNSSFTQVEQSFLKLQETSTTASSSRQDEVVELETEPKIKSSSDSRKDGIDESDKYSIKHRSKHKKHKKSKIKKSSRSKQVRYLKRFVAKNLKELIKDDDEFYEDRRRELGNLSVDTLHRPAVPKYHCPKKQFHSAKSSKRRAENSRKGRYFRFDWGKVESENFICGSRFEDSSETNESLVTVTSEEDILEKTSRFNRQLAEEPNNVELWMQYINFQDSTLKYQPVTANFSSVRKKLAIAKKLSIVEKALSLNPLSEELLKEKLHLAELLYPPGKLKSEALDMLSKDPTNLLLWRAVIHSSQFSLAQCTVPGTQIAYANALERIHHARRGSTQETSARLSKSMIELLFECMLFMRQAGLWEHLLTLIRLSLELNLAVPGSSSFQFNIPVPEDQIRELEDSILDSGLPMSAIWLRVERLRELCYWLPVAEELANDSVDPQRIVFANDVSNLLHPITDSSLNLQSVVMTILLLKVPLLPTSDSAVRFLQLDKMPSSFDLVENLLATLYPTGLVPVKYDNHFLKGITELASGPQYLLDKLCRTEFLNLIHSIIERCGSLLHPSKAVILFSWYIRLCRFIMCVSALDGIPLPTNHNKSLKAFSKGLLKKPAFRDELCLYSEYALVERDMGNLDSSLHILQTAAKLRKYMPENAAYSGIHRNLVETLMRADPVNNRQKAVDILCNLVSTSDVSSASEKFHHVSIELMLKLEREGIVGQKWELEDVLRPHYMVEWTACHAYFLLLSQTVWASAAFVEKALDEILPQAKPATVGMIICEGLYEVLINVLHFHCVQTLSSFSVLQKIVYKAHGIFPNNLNILHVMGLIETNAGSAGSPWWKLTSVFTLSKSIFAKLFLIFISRARIESSQKEAGWTETSGRNQMQWLFGQLMIDDQVRYCPLFWRLCLQFFALHKNADTIKKTFYKAVEDCPWVKAIYLDAVQLLPENLQEIQDLLIEKELRLHSTLDELEILRSGNV